MVKPGSRSDNIYREHASIDLSFVVSCQKEFLIFISEFKCDGHKVKGLDDNWSKEISYSLEIEQISFLKCLYSFHFIANVSLSS